MEISNILFPVLTPLASKSLLSHTGQDGMGLTQMPRSTLLGCWPVESLWESSVAWSLWISNSIHEKAPHVLQTSQLLL